MLKRTCSLLLAMSALVCGACDKAQLLAPTNSTITVAAAARALPVKGTTEVTAFVLEQNGTIVRFSTSLGSVNPVEAQTRSGLAVTMRTTDGRTATARAEFIVPVI